MLREKNLASAFDAASGRRDQRSGILTVKVMNLFRKEKINPIIGISGVSAIPMSPRVAQIWGQKYDRKNYLLMHAMGACLGGSIGSPAAAGMLLAMFK